MALSAFDNYAILVRLKKFLDEVLKGKQGNITGFAEPKFVRIKRGQS